MAAPRWWVPYIIAQSRRRGLDPNAVLGIAAHEGLSGNAGDNNTSFGPFQLHRGGALPGGKGRAWAESRAGINYALDRIAGVARGLRGKAAVTAISTRFERPANPASEIADAMAHYGHVSGSGGGGGGAASSPGLDLAGRLGASGGVSGPSQNPVFAALIQSSNELAAGHLPDSNSLLGALAAQRELASQPSPQAQQVAGAVQGTPGGFAHGGGKVKYEGDMGHLNQGFVNKLSSAISAIGGTKVRITSGYRSPEHNRAVGGAQNSNHMYGRAMDGEVFIPRRGWVPLGTALRGVASRYGLRSGATFTWGGRPDVVHVDDGYNQH